MLDLILLCLVLYAGTWALSGLMALTEKLGWGFLEFPVVLLVTWSLIASASVTFITLTYGAFLLLSALVRGFQYA